MQLEKPEIGHEHKGNVPAGTASSCTCSIAAVSLANVSLVAASSVRLPSGPWSPVEGVRK